MRILVVLRQPAVVVRTLEPVLRLLGEHGHSVRIACQSIKDRASREALLALTEDCPGITFGKVPKVRASSYTSLARPLRLGIDHLRYLEPPFEEPTKMRSDTEKKAPPAVRLLAGVLDAATGPRGVTFLRKLLQRVEQCIPPAPHIERFLLEQAPDVMLITPLVTFGSSQADFLRAARRLGIRTAYFVQSWDNLTTKGLLRDVPDLVLVWNDMQAKEAVTLHQVPRGQVRVTGAPGWDHWFERRPRRSRDEFCDEVRLRPDKPIVLYLGSHPWVIGGREEVDFVRRWMAALRAHGGLLAEAGILVRPHPARNRSDWARARLDDPRAAVWPRDGEQPLDDWTRQNYFESIHYASAVFGINTSAQIESAIVGRPVHTLLADDFRETQAGTVHFNYLQGDDIGLLYGARTLDEHAALLEASLRDATDGGRNERFVERFVRPFGRDIPATPLVVEAIEELAARPAPLPDRGPAIASAVSLGLKPLAALAARRAGPSTSATTTPPARELRAFVRGLTRDPASRPIVAGPWLGDEIAELLYWIPFLRYIQTAALGRDARLWVVARAGSSSWYRGVGTRHVLVDQLVPNPELAALALRFPDDGLDTLRAGLASLVGTDDFRAVPPRLIAPIRAERVRRDSDARFQRQLDRVLDLAPLDAPDPGDLELPDDFLAVRFAFDSAYPATDENRGFAVEAVAALARRATVVVLEPVEPLRELESRGDPARVRLLKGVGREREAAILARSDGFLGSYGSSAFVAALLGVPAVALYSKREHVLDEDLQIASSFLGRKSFGRLEALEASGSARGAGELAARLTANRERLSPPRPAR
jgi:hypothetical protein